MIKNIVFDMGGVLIHDNPMDFLIRYIDADQADRELILRELCLGPEWKFGWDNGTMSTEEVAKSVCGRLTERLHPFVHCVMENWNMDPKVIPGMENLIRSLKKSGCGVYILSNTAVTYYDYRHKLPAIDCFDGQFVSADYQVLKPNKEIYEKFVQVFKLVPEECYFIDDKPENVNGAVAAGWGGGFVFSGETAALEEALKPVLGSPA